MFLTFNRAQENLPVEKGVQGSPILFWKGPGAAGRGSLVLKNMGACYMQLNRLEEAKSCFEKALKKKLNAKRDSSIVPPTGK